MITVTIWTRAWCRIGSCMMVTRVALVVSKFRQACHYEFLVIKDVTGRSILIEDG